MDRFTIQYHISSLLRFAIVDVFLQKKKGTFIVIEDEIW